MRFSKKRVSFFKFFFIIILSASALSANAAQSNFEAIYKKFNQADSDQVMVVAHRGCWKNAPENSLKAIRDCIDMGVDIIEIDLKKTKDGALVIMHDPVVDRTTTGVGEISKMTLQEIKFLRLKNHKGLITNEQIPTLEEVMNLVKGKVMVNLDKGYEYLTDAVKVLKKTGTLDQAIYKGNENPKKVRRDIKKFRGKLIYMPVVDFRKMDWKNDTYLQGTSAIKPYIKNLKPPAIEIVVENKNNPIIDAYSIRYMRENGARVWINTLKPSICAGCYDGISKGGLDWAWFIKRGSNMLQTDEPAKLIRYLKARGLHE